jgi:hypothetical protein
MRGALAHPREPRKARHSSRAGILPVVGIGAVNLGGVVNDGFGEVHARSPPASDIDRP